MASRRSWISPRRAGSAPPRSVSASSAARSVSASSTVSRRLRGPAGASCATWPRRARAARRISPPSGASSPEIARSKVDFPAPLRPTRPTRRPGSTARSASSSKARPAMRMVRLRMASTVMARGFYSKGRAAVARASAVSGAASAGLPASGISGRWRRASGRGPQARGGSRPSGRAGVRGRGGGDPVRAATGRETRGRALAGDGADDFEGPARAWWRADGACVARAVARGGGKAAFHGGARARGMDLRPAAMASSFL